MFPKSFLLTALKKYGKSALIKILLVFLTVETVDCQRNFWDGAE